MHHLRYVVPLLAASLALPPALFAQQQNYPYIELSNGRQVKGDSIRAKSNGDLVLTIGSGTKPFPVNSYKIAYSKPPTEAFTKASSFSRQGEGDKAAEVLKSVIDSHRFLGWDLQAASQLSEILLQQSKAAESVTIYEEILEDQPIQRKNPAVIWPYWSSLVGAGKGRQISKELDKMIASGNRSVAAKAQILRGDMQFVDKRYHEAVLDYLRTVALFQSEEEPQPEALYKTGIVFEQLRDKRAKNMFEKAAVLTPRSSAAARWVERAKAKL